MSPWWKKERTKVCRECGKIFVPDARDANLCPDCLGWSNDSCSRCGRDLFREELEWELQEDGSRVCTDCLNKEREGRARLMTFSEAPNL